MATDPSVVSLNGGTVADGRFCSACEQATAVGRLRLRQVLDDFLPNTIGLDGRIPSTLVNLVRRTGATVRE